MVNVLYLHSENTPTLTNLETLLQQSLKRPIF